jgi:CheY-like chemotaxis protein/two-component sensor histidine kinase
MNKSSDNDKAGHLLNETLEQRVAERTTQLQVQSDRLRIMANKLSHAEQKERRRLAGMLHDNIQPLIVGARMQLWEIQRKNDIHEIKKTADKIESILEQALSDLRSLSSDLSPSMLLTSGLSGGLKGLISYMEKNFQFKVSLLIDNDLEPVSDETSFLLFECVKELLLNIVKHAGITQADISAVRMPDDIINLVISDQGNGFDLDQFRQVQNSSTSFGLFSIQERLVAISGRMLVESSPGMGTKVRLTVPAGEPVRKIKDRRHPPEKYKPPKSDRVRFKNDMISILIVDDHKILREGLKGLLQLEPDFHISGEAESGEKAIELADQLLPDVIIMDINLGKTHGVTVTRQILSKHPQIKIIGLSMHDDEAVIEAMYDAGAVAYLTKSARSEEIIAAVRNSIS